MLPETVGDDSGLVSHAASQQLFQKVDLGGPGRLGSFCSYALAAPQTLVYLSDPCEAPAYYGRTRSKTRGRRGFDRRLENRSQCPSAQYNGLTTFEMLLTTP